VIRLRMHVQKRGEEKKKQIASDNLDEGATEMHKRRIRHAASTFQRFRLRVVEHARDMLREKALSRFLIREKENSLREFWTPDTSLFTNLYFLCFGLKFQSLETQTSENLIKIVIYV